MENLLLLLVLVIDATLNGLSLWNLYARVVKIASTVEVSESMNADVSNNWKNYVQLLQTHYIFKKIQITGIP